MLVMGGTLHAQVWTMANTMGSTTILVSNGIVSDPNGDFFVTGHFTGTADFGNGITLSANPGGNDLFVAKYNAGGSVQWAVKGISPGDDKGYEIALDATGDPYVTGYYTGTLQLATGTGTVSSTSAGATDILLAKFNRTNGNCLWLTSAGGSLYDAGTDLTVIGDAVYITGYFENSATFGALPTVSSYGGKDVFAASYNQFMTLWDWATKGGTTADDDASAICNDGADIFVAGHFTGPSFTFGSTNLPMAGGVDGFVTRIVAPTGTPVWSSYIASNTHDERPTALSSDGQDVYVTGTTSGPAILNFKGAPVVTITAPGAGTDFWVAKFNGSSGDAAWAEAEGGSGTDVSNGIVSTGPASISVTGSFEGAITLAGNGFSGPGSEVFIETFNPISGSPLASVHATGPGASTANDITYDPYCGLLITGQFNQTLSFLNWGTLTAPGPLNGFNARMSASSVLLPANSPATATLCQGDSITIQLTGIFNTVTWEASTDNGATWTAIQGVTGDSIRVAPGMPTWYRSSFTGTCLAGMDTSFVGIFSPTVQIQGLPLNACVTDTPMTISSGTSTATFSPGGSALVDLGNGTAMFYPQNFGTGTMTVYCHDTVGNCVAADTATVTIHALPVVNLGGLDTNYCAGAGLDSLMGNYASDYVFAPNQAWLQDLGNGIAAFDPAQAPLSTPLVLTYTYTSPFGCAAMASHTVEVHPLPSPAISNLQPTYCVNDTVQIIKGNYLNWGVFVSGPWLTYLGSGLAAIDPVQATPDDTAWVAYVVTDSNGCQGADSQWVYISGLPVADAGADQSVCAARWLTLGNPAVPGHSYAWYAQGGALVDTVAQPAVALLSTETYTLLVTNAFSCTANDDVTVTVLQAPVADAGLDSLICQGMSVTLGGTVAGNVVVAWSDSLGFQSGLPHPLVAPAQSLVYTLVVTDSTGNCSDTDRVNIMVVLPPPTADAGADQDVGDLAATTLAASSPGTGTGTWSCAGCGLQISDIHSPTSDVWDIAAGTWTMVWTVENAPCAMSRDSMVIVAAEFRMPTGFSPNGDGVNDVLVFSGLEFHPENRLEVFNRWGSVVYRAEGYRNDWAGTNAQGEPLVEDTYYYVLELEDGQAVNRYLVLKRN
jgi:gliding motility-associated-like protein